MNRIFCVETTPMLPRTILILILLMSVLEVTAEEPAPPKPDPGSVVPPAKPAWAAEVQKDEYGFFADLSTGGVTQRMRWIKPGSFEIRDQGGNRQVAITRGYWLADSELTQGFWQAVMGTNPSESKGDGKRPVENVSWGDCQEFLKRLNGQVQGLSAGLPTEAQWEYACRAGTDGDYAGDLSALAWFARTANEQTHPVKTKQPNAWGLYDMHGNVWEWCADWIALYPAGPLRDPAGPASGTQRVYRGGGYHDAAKWCRAAVRAGRPPDTPNRFLGFRFAAPAAP